MKKIFPIIVILLLFYSSNIMPIESGRLVFIDTESGSNIYINNRYFGKAPILVKLAKVNEAVIKVEGITGFSEEKFFINENIKEVYFYKPDLKEYKTILKIITEPEYADVLIDDISYKNKPVSIEGMPPGKHSIEVFSKGYKSVKEEINIIKNRINEKKIELKKIYLLKFMYKLPDDAIIKITGQDKSYSSDQNIYLDNGNYEVNILSSLTEQNKTSFSVNINNNDFSIEYKPVLKKSRIKFINFKKNYRIFIDESDITDKIYNNIYYCNVGNHTIIIKEKYKKPIFYNIKISENIDTTIAIK